MDAGEASSGTSGRTVAVLAIVVALIIASVAYVAAWLNAREYPFGRRPFATQDALMGVQRAMQAQRAATGTLPPTLRELVPTGDDNFSRGADGVPLDGWGHALEYTVHGDEFELWSWGRDGLAGGVGLDTDGYSDGRGWDQSLATLGQFASDLDDGRAANVAIICGLLGATLCYLSLTRYRMGPGLVGVITPLVVSLALTGVVTAALVFLHAIPSGH